VEVIFQLLFNELQQSTRASKQNCRDVAFRLTAEIIRVCNESRHIQASGDLEAWANRMARHRLHQCLNYYRLGSAAGRVELHSTLSAIIYRYMTPVGIALSYQARLTLIEDFLQGFYLESLKVFRKEALLGGTYRPHTLLELAEYLAFTERYAKRRVHLSSHKTQQLVILRVQTFVQQHPRELSVDLEQAAESRSSESETAWDERLLARVREMMVATDPDSSDMMLRQSVIRELLAYLEQHQQRDCADYFILRWQNLSADEIEEILDLTPRQRDYLQQRFKYHLMRFALLHGWELVHEWLGADLERNLGLTPQQWQGFQTQLSQEQRGLLQMKQRGLDDKAIAKSLGWKVSQVHKQWFKLLETAWVLRNSSESGSGASTHE
jgi:DNA-binding NarL/FixJ family response regulator